MGGEALLVTNLGKKFKLYNNPKDRLREFIFRTPAHKDFWALKDINFEVKRGEFFGILGHNGAGKSTLLKLISGILYPTIGTIESNGKVLSIFGLSLGNSDQLTGRLNIINRAKVLGYSEEFINEKIEEVISFSELGEFIDYPVATYSSGMKSRLSFSLYSILDADILILDEVLAVGDIFFKQKCYDRIAQLHEMGTTIILVTHSINSIRQYCSRSMVLNMGRQVFIGETKEAINIYSKLNLRTKKMIPLKESATHMPSESREEKARKWYGKSIEVPLLKDAPILNLPISKEPAILSELCVLNEAQKPTLAFVQGERISIYYSFIIRQPIFQPYAGVFITDLYGNMIHNKTSTQLLTEMPEFLTEGDTIKFLHHLELNIQVQPYFLGLRLGGVFEGREIDLFGLYNSISFDVISPAIIGKKPTFSGLCDLPSSCVSGWSTPEHS